MWQHHPEGEYCAIYNPKFTTANSRKTWREAGSAHNKMQLLITWRLETRRAQDTCDGYVTHLLQMSILPNQTLIFLKHSDPSFQWDWNMWIPPQFSSYQLNAHFLYSITIYMLHYNPQHVLGSTLLILRRTSCIITASGIVTLCKRPYSMPAVRSQPAYCTAVYREWRYQRL